MLLTGKSVYIHIPFCNKICSYCDFCKVFYNDKWINSYLKSLENEIKEKYLDEIISTIYIGGGTPSSLKIKDLKKLFNIIKLFKLNENIEFTFECNLNDINEELINFLSLNKVNRISIGIESFDKDNLKFMNREANYKDALTKINMIKKYINNINIDLIYALPNEKISTLKKDLRLFNSLDVNHISTYSLIIEEHTMISKIKPISEDIDAKMYNIICSYLKKKHFIHYEISNFSKDGYESKHNLTYWNNLEYYGFGCGASGYIEGVRYNNTRSLTEYIKCNYILDEEILSEKDKMNYEIMLGLRKTKGINVKEFYNKYHVNIQNKYKIKELINNKELIYKNGNVFISPDKLYVMNEILVKLV